MFVVTGLLRLIAFPFGAFNRERARKPFLIYGKMYMTQNFVAAPAPTSIVPPTTTKTGEQIIT